jgi:hypothetical protein
MAVMKVRIGGEIMANGYPKGKVILCLYASLDRQRKNLFATDHVKTLECESHSWLGHCQGPEPTLTKAI